MFSGTKKIYSVRTKKLHNKQNFFKLFKFFFFYLKLFLGLRKFSNENVQHKGLLLQDWVFRLGSRVSWLMKNKVVYLVLKS